MQTPTRVGEPVERVSSAWGASQDVTGLGANFSDHLREAWRTLKIDGALHIWEATSRFDDPEAFARSLVRLGFKAFSPESSGKFTYIEARRAARTPDEDAALKFRG